MIKKKREDYQNIEGAGRPFEMNPRDFEPKNDIERQKPVVINLGDLNSPIYDKGTPKNFHRKAGRVLPSFMNYWSPEEMKDVQEDAFDIE